MMTYLIMTAWHHPIEHFTDLDEAREYIRSTTYYIKYVPAPGEAFVKPTTEGQSCSNQRH